MDGYGYLWWMEEEGYSALGYLDTNMLIYPGHDLVIVRMQKPKGGTFSGKTESGNYQSLAYELLKIYFDGKPADKIPDIMKKISVPE